MVEKFFDQIKQRKDVRKVLSELRSVIKEEIAYQEAVAVFGAGEELFPLLKDPDAKVRKNVAALIGDLQIKEAAEELFLAYQKEDILFVKSTLLQALERTGAYPFLDKLQERYEQLCNTEVLENEKKHVLEEIKALEKILRKEGKDIRHTFCGWNKKLTILLTTNTKYGKITSEQFSAYRKGSTSLGVKAVVDDLREVVKVRTFRELLFPISLKETVGLADGPIAFGKALANSKLVELLELCHKESAPFYFRIDMKAGISLEERSRYIKKAAVVIEEASGRKLLNSASDYEFEIRLFLDKEQKIHVFLKMCTIPMERFSYRKETIATSIQPSAAALFMELAKPYLKENAQILDPCCGVGTMLVERHKLMKAREIYGIDLFGEAIDKARKNAAEANMRVNFINKDYLEFQHAYLFDEIIANMPMRGKKTKEEQDIFYEKFFHKSEALLAPKGVMILYSNENAFIKKQLRLHKSLKLLQEYVISDKEQFCLYIIEMREK